MDLDNTFHFRHDYSSIGQVYFGSVQIHYEIMPFEKNLLFIASVPFFSRIEELAMSIGTFGLFPD